jgi:serine/threonine-protein kinase RsbW
MEIKTLLVDNQIGELTKVVDFLDVLGEEWELPVGLVFSLNLVMEEALTNIILYGFEDNNRHTIEINFSKKGEDELSITLIDDGQPYDPTLKEDPDLTLSVEERPIGGLGIFLIKRIMDKVEYQRNNNKNLLILTKNINS